MGLGKRMRGFGGRAIGALAAAASLLTLSAPAAAVQPAGAPEAAASARPAPRPAIWLLEDEDTRIYLFGTTHILPATFRWRSERLNAIVLEADELVMETADQATFDREAMARWMIMPKPVSILSRVSAPRRPRLLELIEASGLPIEAWDMFHTWAAGFMLFGVQVMQGMREEGQADGQPFDMRKISGVERVLSAAFRRAGKPVSAVETSAQQMAMFRGMSAPAQRAFLESMIDDGSPVGPQAVDFDALWASGNTDAIAAQMEALPPEIFEVLLTRRNRAWTEWLAARLDRPGTVLFAVGAGHLAGRDSVQTMLAARGLTARRID